MQSLANSINKASGGGDGSRADPLLRRRATVQAVGLTLVSGGLAWLFHQPVPALIVAGLAVVTGFCGWFAPAWFGVLDKAVRTLARLIGTAMTWILLVPFYYLFFGIARLCLVVRGRDPMTRRWNNQQTSYWVARPPVTSPDYYRRQY